jgi:hypothetical protein
MRFFVCGIGRDQQCQRASRKRFDVRRATEGRHAAGDIAMALALSKRQAKGGIDRLE